MLTTESPPVNGNTRRRVALDMPLTDKIVSNDWMSLFDRDSQASPLQHPDYVLTELKTAPAHSRFRPVALRCGTETECDGMGILVPKSVRTDKVGGARPAWMAHGMRLPGGAFLTADQTIETQAQLLNAAVGHCTAIGADFLLIEDLDEQSALYHAVQSAPANSFELFAARDSQPRWRIDFPTSEVDYWKNFSSRTRRAFRTRLKRFGETRLERITQPEQIPTFLAAANEVSKHSWQSRQFGLRIRNDQAERQQLGVLAHHGFLRSYLWWVEGQPAAFALCHQHAGCFRYEEIAYCAQFSPLSPGETMLQQIVEDLYRYESPRQFDFGGGDAEYKRRFGNRESRSQTVWLVPPTWRGRSLRAYLNACRAVRSTLRTAVKATGLATKARQWLRYGGRADHAKHPSAAESPVADESESSSAKEGH